MLRAKDGEKIARSNGSISRGGQMDHSGYEPF
jgi:hypothetical protein